MAVSREKDLKRVEQFINSVQWKEARTYRNSTPHEYLLLKEVPQTLRDEYLFLTHVIKLHGAPEGFFTTMYQYLRVGEWKYWVMAPPGVTPILINRALIKYNYT